MNDLIPADLLDDAEVAAIDTAELDEALMLGNEPPERAQRFRIDNLSQAEWAMRKLAAVVQRRVAIEMQAAEWTDKIVRWERAERKRVDGAERYFEGLLERYGVEQRAADNRRATIPLPSGEIKTTRPKTPTVSIVDEQAVIAWAADNLPSTVYEEVVKAEPHVLVSELKRRTEVRQSTSDFCGTCGASMADHLVEAGAPGAPDHSFDIVQDWRVVYVPEFSPNDAIEVPGVSATLGDTTARARPLV